MSLPKSADIAKLAQVGADSGLLQLLQVPGNDTCAECGTADPRWASWNIGVFVCVRCAGIHRSLGSHISKIKSVTLDAWTPAQLKHLSEVGNLKAASIYTATLPTDYVMPDLTTDGGLQLWIRSKYERKLFMSEAQQTEQTASSSSSGNQATEFMDIYVSQPEIEWDTLNSSKGKYTTYLVTVSTNIKGFPSKHFSVRRRYNDFYKLHHDLSNLIKNKFTKLPDFPPKTGFRAESRFSPSVIEFRRSEFEKLLNATAMNPVLRKSEPLRKFLKADGPDTTNSGSSSETTSREPSPPTSPVPTRSVPPLSDRNITSLSKSSPSSEWESAN